MTANPAWSSFFNDSNEDVAQLSPGFARPGTGSREDSMGFPLKDDRRPSVASATTVSSTGSKSSISRGFHKRLQNVFGEDFPADGRQNSDSSLADAQSMRTRNRGNSLNNTPGSYNSRPTSPTSSRPRTPQPSSEVTPWEYQDSKVSPPKSEADFGQARLTALPPAYIVNSAFTKKSRLTPLGRANSHREWAAIV